MATEQGKKGDMPPITETGEKLESNQMDQIGDMLLDSSSVEEPTDGANKHEKFLEGGNPGKDGGKVDGPADDDASDDDEDEYDDDDFEEEEGDASDDSSDDDDADAEDEGGEDNPTIAALIAQNERLERMLEKALGGKDAEDVETPPAARVEIDSTDFMSEDDLEAFNDDPVKFLREFGAKIYTRAREDTINDIPGLVESTARRQQAYSEARSKFFQNYPELATAMQGNKRVASLVRDTANDIQQEHPAWSVEKIFSETGKEVRALLKLNADADNVDEKSRKKTSNQPRKPRGKRRGKDPVDKSGLQSQLDSMLDSIE